MCAVYTTDRAFTVFYKLQLSIPVNEGKAAKRLRKIMKEIPPGFDIIVRIDAEVQCHLAELQFLLASVQG